MSPATIMVATIAAVITVITRISLIDKQEEQGAVAGPSRWPRLCFAYEPAAINYPPPFHFWVVRPEKRLQRHG